MYVPTIVLVTLCGLAITGMFFLGLLITVYRGADRKGVEVFTNLRISKIAKFAGGATCGRDYESR